MVMWKLLGADPTRKQTRNGEIASLTSRDVTVMRSKSLVTHGVLRDIVVWPPGQRDPTREQLMNDR